jgi:hypothetical protein
MKITLDMPNPPTNQAIIEIPLHFCGGKVVEAGGYGFEECKTDTCTNDGKDYAEFDQFVCSKCGIELQDWNRVERCDDGEIIYHEYTFRFCPHCGRKIVEGE